MAPWFKKKPAAAERLVEFNIDKLKRELGNLGEALYEHRNDRGFLIIREVIELARNIQLLEVSRYKGAERIQIHQGRLESMSDILDFISNHIKFQGTEGRKESPKPDQHAVRAIHKERPKPTNIAGSAI